MRSARVRPQSLVQVQAPLRVIAASALLLLPRMSAKLRARRESLTPAQLRALLPKMMTVIRSRRASLLAELESMGGQAPTTADFPEPSRDELEREANAAALQQLILRAQSQWKEERAALRAAIEGAGSERVRARSPAASGGPPSKRRRSVETSTPCGEGASLGEMYQKLVFGNSGIKTNSAGPAGSRSPREAPESRQTCRGMTLINAPEATENLSFRLTAASLFCGAGGMDVGFNRAGFKTIWAADKNSAACATYGRYAQQTIALRKDLAKEDFKKLREQLACTPDCVFGGPPCQGFSRAGKMNQTDARNDLINVFLDAVEKLRPRCFVMENVKNLNNERRFGPLLAALTQRAEKLGYSCATEVVNCNLYDVPQARERLIFVGFLRGGELRHANTYFFRALRRYRKRAQTSGEAVRSLGRAGSETNPLGSKAKIVVTKNPVIRQSPYAGMLFNGMGRPSIQVGLVQL